MIGDNKIFKKRKWWYEDIVEGRYDTREKLYNAFVATVKTAKCDGFDKEETRRLLVGVANLRPTNIVNLPLHLLWLDKYWDDIEGE